MKLFRTTIIAIPRNADAKDLDMAIDGLECIQIDISNTLETKLNSQNIWAKESHFERHKQNSKSDIDSDLELGFEKNKGKIWQVNLKL